MLTANIYFKNSNDIRIFAAHKKNNDMKTLKIKTQLEGKELVNALGRGYREGILANGGGFKSTTKAHKSKKDYTRKPKHKGLRFTE
jgi:hypothetical protein